MRRAAVSIASNIVEGCGRQSESDYVRFLELAHSSARELEYQLSLAVRLGYVNETDQQQVTSLAEETNKVLAGLLRALRATKQGAP
jgi:four helix bundle protein